MLIYIAATTQVLALDLDWKTKASMTTERSCLAAVALNGKIYAIGGSEGIKVLEEYNPITGTWTRKADMLVGGRWLGAAVLNGKIYTFRRTS
ncbi:MAG: hypothetical protein AB1567_11145 [bacterium]